MDLTKCANCGLIEDPYNEDRCGFNAIPYRDVCPTDRGDEIREGTEWLCDDCYQDLCGLGDDEEDIRYIQNIRAGLTQK